MEQPAEPAPVQGHLHQGARRPRRRGERLNRPYRVLIARWMRTGGASVWPSAGAAWIFRTTSMPPDDPAERREPLPVRIPLSPKSSSGCSPTQMKTHGERCRARPAPSRSRRRDAQAGFARALERDRREELRLLRAVRRGLDHLDLHRVGRLIGLRHRAVKRAVLVKACKAIGEEVLHRHGRVLGVELDLDLAEVRLDHDSRPRDVRALRQTKRGERAGSKPARWARPASSRSAGLR